MRCRCWRRPKVQRTLTLVAVTSIMSSSFRQCICGNTIPACRLIVIRNLISQIGQGAGARAALPGPI